MDKPTVYIETSIVSYLAANPSRDPVTARNQRLTHEWWNTHRHAYALYTSKTVVEEAAEGNQAIAARRLSLLAPVKLLRPRDDVALLANEILSLIRLPERAATDALHIAFATVYGVSYLLTWNCAHIANPALRPRLERACRLRGFDLPVLCTTKSLLEG